MPVTVKIKQKGLFKKKLDLKEIIDFIGLSYGKCDESYRLVSNEIANHTLIYDTRNLARGIDLSLEDNVIVLLLSLPTTKEEIRLFYSIIHKLCSKFKIQTFIREEETVYLNDIEKFIQCDEEGSIAGLKGLEEGIHKDQGNRFEIFGVYNPISLGIDEIKEIGCDLDHLSLFLHRLQSMDVYYASPKVYKVHDRLIGIYAIGVDILSVVPTEPYIILNQIKGIEAWYVFLDEGKMVPFADFIKNVNIDQKYDANHVIVRITEAKKKQLVDQYLVEI